MVSLIVASPIDLEAIVTSEDRPAYVDTYRIRALRMVGGQEFGGKVPHILHMIEPTGNALLKARQLFDQHGIDILAMQRHTTESDGTVVRHRRIDRAEIKNYVLKIWDYDSEGEPIPGTARKPDPSSWCIFGGAANWQ